MANLSFFAGGRQRRLQRRNPHGNYYVRFQYKGEEIRHSLGTTINHVAIAKAKEKIEAAINGDIEALRKSKLKSDYSLLSEIAEIYVAKFSRNGTDRRRSRTARGNVGHLAKIVRIARAESPQSARADILTGKVIRDFEELEEKRIECDADGYASQQSELSIRTSICSVVRQARSIFKPSHMEWYERLVLPSLDDFRRQGVTAPDRPLPQPLDQRVIDAIYADAPRLAREDIGVYAAFLCFSQLGMRNGEIKAAKIGWIRRNLDGSGLIDIKFRPLENFRPKRKTERSIPIDKYVLVELTRLASLYEEGYLVPAGSPSERDDIVDDQHCAWAGQWIKDRTKISYELRRHAGSEYYKQTREICQVQKFLGHANLRTTMEWYWYLIEKLQPLATPPWLQPAKLTAR